ncbi:MAG: alpha/beta hydrolase family protein [Pirellula sp.]
MKKQISGSKPVRSTYVRWGSTALSLSLTLGLSHPLSSTGLAKEPIEPTPLAESKYAIKDLDGHFPFAVPETKEAWESRAKELRQQMLVSLGMYPMPTLAAVKPVVHSRRELDGYAIEKVYFESLPGLFVTGSLYTPTSPLPEGQKRPAVLCPHGHWANGRFYYTADGEMKRELATGAERFESAARSPLQARCVQMARMGIVVFHYDMMGNADNLQISAERVHGFGNPKVSNPEVAPGKWLLYSTKAEGMLQNIMGMQTINSIQSLEFLLQRPDVDPKRISITGASGGGTQTFVASAIEPRFAGAYPVVMVSTSMQGGCTCENAVGLRVNTGNVELAALTAPRPLGVNAANDWTKDMAKDGFPELRKLYGLYGAPDAVTFHNATHFGHNYNHVTRVPMYGFMNRLFGLGLQEPILERDFQVLKAADMTVWDDQHPKPQGGIEFETELLERWAKDVSAKVEASPEIRQTGWKTILSPANAVAKSLTVTDAKSENDVTTIRVINADGTNVGVLKTRVPLGTPGLKIRLLSDLKTAEAPKADEVLLAIDDAWGVNFGASEQSLVKNPRPAACYTYGYNPSLYLRKLAVLLALLDAPSTKSISGGQWQAQGALGTMIDAVAVLRPQTMKAPEMPNSFDFSQVASIKDANMLPGALRFGNTAGLRLTARELSKQ